MEKRQARPERIPVNGTRDILTVSGRDPNYEYRWVLDQPGRIDKFKQAGYEVVTDDLKVGQKAVDSSDKKLGSAITTSRGGQTLVLMRVLKEWYEEDQKAKQDKVDALEATLQDEARSGGFPGSGSRERGSYTPEGGGLNIKRR